MCGLVGLISRYSNGFTRTQLDTFSTLLFIDYLRGMDSTGVFLVQNDGNLSLAKEASNPIDFMATKEYGKIGTTAMRSGSALIGHNRKATRGTVNDKNAHPFVVDDKIILVHNGTMHGDHKKIADVEVDSHAIAHAIHESSDDVGAALSRFDAAYALIYHDFERNRLNLIRNKERPLWWMEIDDGWVWASERSMLKFVAAKHSLKVIQQPAELEPDVLQMYTLRDGGGWDATFEKQTITKPAYKYSGGQGMPSVAEWQAAMEEQWGEYYESRNGRNVLQMPTTHTRPRVDVAWPEDDEGMGDIPFDSKADTTPTRRIGSTPLLSAAEAAHEKLEMFEKRMCSRGNKIITLGQYQVQVAEDFEQDTSHYAMGYDYTFANMENENGGYFLYMTMANDPDIVVRYWFSKEHADLQRIKAMATEEWVFKIKVGIKMWKSFGGNNGTNNTAIPGYCIIRTSAVELIYGGGVGDSNWMHKMDKAERTIQ